MSDPPDLLDKSEPRIQTKTKEMPPAAPTRLAVGDAGKKNREQIFIVKQSRKTKAAIRRPGKAPP